MITHAGRAAYPDTTESFWLDRLKEAHADLLDAIGELERLTHGPVPDKEHLIGVRWRVSEASLARRLLWGRIHALLSQHAQASLKHDLHVLQEIDIDLIRASAKHVSRWTADTVIQDWSGYRRGSEIMRAKMIDAIAAEKRLLYPIFESSGGIGH